MKKKVNLFIVGEQKSGTTTLHYILNQHPEIKMSSLKEPGYFCTDFHEESDEYHENNYLFPIRKEDEYLKLFNDVKDKKILGESSSIYLYSKEAVKKIYNYNPKAKIVIMLRNPKTFLPSLHAQYVKEISEDQESLLEALELEEQRKKGKSLPKRVKVPSLLYYEERIKYTNNLKRYFDFFSPNQIKVVIFEDFVKETEKEVEEVLDFLGVNSKIKLDYSPRNEGKNPRFKFIYKILHSPMPKKFLTRILPMNYQVKLSGMVKQFFLTKQTSKREELPDEVKNLCEEEILKLQKFLNSHHKGYNLLEVWGDQ